VVEGEIAHDAQDGHDDYGVLGHAADYLKAEVPVAPVVTLVQREAARGGGEHALTLVPPLLPLHERETDRVEEHEGDGRDEVQVGGELGVDVFVEGVDCEEKQTILTSSSITSSIKKKK
jgi:hypothetical protein